MPDEVLGEEALIADLFANGLEDLTLHALELVAELFVHVSLVIDVLLLGLVDVLHEVRLHVDKVLGLPFHGPP